MRFLAKAGKNEKGEPKLEMNEYTAKSFRDYLRKNQGSRLQIEPMRAESAKQRRYLMGGLLRLWVFLDGNEYRDEEVCERYFEAFKIEHFPETLVIHGESKIFGKSSKGSEMLNKMTERMVDFLVEQYGLEYHSEVLNPASFKKFRDEIFSTGKWDDYISYAKDMKWV